jgi:tetratricopeptide (TPR) repeat protein
VAWAQGDYAHATQRYEEALAIGRKMEGRFTVAAALFGLGRVARSRGDQASASSLYKEALTIWRGTSHRWGIAFSLEALAALAVAQGHMRRAAKLFGAAETLHNLIRFLVAPVERDERAHNLASVRAALGEADFTAAWAEGQAMTEEQAVTYALDTDS